MARLSPDVSLEMEDFGTSQTGEKLTVGITLFGKYLLQEILFFKHIDVMVGCIRIHTI